MFIRQYFKSERGTRVAYWALVESYRTERGPRQRIVTWLGKLDQAGRLGVRQAAEASFGKRTDPSLQLTFDDDAKPAVEPRWVEVDSQGVRVENLRHFGGPWLARELIRQLELDQFLLRVLPPGRERVPWALSAMVLVIGRLLDPSSELHTAEQWYPKTALPDLLGVPAEHVEDSRLYRTLDRLLPHKAALEAHLKQRLGTLFNLEYDLLMYDVTSTYFEGAAARNPLAQRGYSRDQRSDCKQVCIGLVVSRCGLPLGYEVFAGNTTDVTTVEHIVTTMEKQYGRSDRVWVMDRGMVSEKNITFLRDGGRRYIVGTPKTMLREFESEMASKDWHQVRDGLEVKVVTYPFKPNKKGRSSPKEPTEDETFILCRSADRAKKEQAIVARFEARIEQRLTRMASRCEKQKREPMKVEREVGRLLGQNTRAARLFDVKVKTMDDETARIQWRRIEKNRDWATLGAGCYLLRTNIRDWSDEQLWKAYMQLTEAEAAFRIHKSDLRLRPIWHQKEERVLAHILVCFLSFVLWKTLGRWCHQAGLGDEPRRVLAEISEIRDMDVVLETRAGQTLRKRCVSRPSDHQRILLDRLRLAWPETIMQNEM